MDTRGSHPRRRLPRLRGEFCPSSLARDATQDTQTRGDDESRSRLPLPELPEANVVRGEGLRGGVRRAVGAT